MGPMAGGEGVKHSWMPIRERELVRGSHVNRRKMIWKARVCASGRKRKGRMAELGLSGWVCGAAESDACSEAIEGLRYQQTS
jgi:hypothetical protein